jgi:hypothetical protein
MASLAIHPRLYQSSLEDLRKQTPWPEPPQPKVYVPTEAEKKNKWVVVLETYDDAGDPDYTNKVHIIPTRGINHQITEYCWCEPCFQKTKRGSLAVLHNVSQ